MTKAMVAALMASTTLVTFAFAQDRPDIAQIEDDQVCAELVSYVENNETGDSEITNERAQTIAQGDDPEVCRDAFRMAAGEISAREGDANFDADAAARVQIAVPDPDVTVDQAAPQVDVAQPRPEVAVTPGRPVVTVNQAEPVVRVQTTPPTITIEMPKPEILVEMPDPTVDVSMAQPRVTVTQPDPQVNVEQGEVRLQVADQEVEGSTGEPTVNIERAEAAVQMEEAAAANVSVADVTPRVSYNAAEPRIEVENEGEPQIEFSQSGEANVQFRQMSREETEEEASRQSAEGNEAATAGEEAATRTDDGGQEMARADVAAATSANNEPTGTKNSMTVEELSNLSVVGSGGETIGDVESIAEMGGETVAIVGTGGFLGLAERQIAIPISDLRLVDDALRATDLTRQAVSDMDEVAADAYTVREPSATVDISAQ